MSTRKVVIAGIRESDYATLRRCIAHGAVVGSVRFHLVENWHEESQSAWLGLGTKTVKTVDVAVVVWSDDNNYGTVDDFCDFFLAKYIKDPLTASFYGSHLAEYRDRVRNWCEGR